MADDSPLKKIFASRANTERPQAGTRFGISWPLLAALCLVLVGAVAWAFFMGYMVGKGEHPGESLGVVSSQEERKPDDKAPDGDLTPPLPASPAIPESQSASNVLQPPTGAAAAAWPEAKPQPARQERKQAQKATAKSEPGVKSDYVFQAAAIRSQAEANKMRDRLIAKKLRASVRKSGKVYLLMINLRGDAADVAKMKSILKSVSLGAPLQISKKPVNAAKSDKRK